MKNKIPNNILDKFKINTDAFYCPFCNRMTISPKNINSKIKMCALCASFERQRFLFYVYNDLFLNTNKQLNVLHFAPEKSIYDLISKNPNINYITCDLEPENYPYVKNIEKQDGLNLTYKNDYFDVVIHNHVLEHVENPINFLKENFRVLNNGGKIISSIPYYPEDLCDDTKTTYEERIKYYGQYDHLRKFGKDF